MPFRRFKTWSRFASVQSSSPGFFSLSPCLRLFVATLSPDTPQLKGIRALTSATRFSRTRIICLSSIPLSLPDNLSSSSSSVRVAEENSRSVHLEKIIRSRKNEYILLYRTFYYFSILYICQRLSPRNYSNTTFTNTLCVLHIRKILKFC